MKFCLSILLMLVYSDFIFSQKQSLVNNSDTIIYSKYKNGKAPFSYKGKMGIIDSLGNVVLEAKYDRVRSVFNDNSFSYHYIEIGKKEAVIDTNWKIIIPPIYDDISPSIEGFFTVKRNGLYTFVDTSGIQMKEWFKEVKFFRCGLAPVKVKNRWGFINKLCNISIKTDYPKVSVFSENCLAAVKKNGKWGFINQNNQISIPCTYNKVRYFWNGLCAVKKGNKWGFIDSNENIIIPFIYDDALFFLCELASVKINGKYGFINMSNEFVIPPIYIKAHTFGKDSKNTMVKKNLFKWIWINKKGECVYSCD